MKKLIFAIACLPAFNISASTNVTPSATGQPGVFLSPNTNVAVTEIFSPLLITNVSLFGYNSVYSNSTLSDFYGEPIPGFQPFGGNYFGLCISNSLEISQSNQNVVSAAAF